MTNKRPASPIDYLNPTKKYRPTGGGYWSGIESAIFDGEPIWTWYEIPRMMRDERVKFALRMLRAPFGQCKFTVKAKTDVVAKFVLKHFKKIWKRYSGRLLQRYFQYGFAAYGVEYASKNGRCVVQKLDIIEPRDATPLEYNAGEHKGEFGGIQYPQGVALRPYAGWYAGEQEYDRYRDIPRLAGAYAPWLEKRSRGGAVHSRRLFYFRHAVGNDCLWFPQGDTNIGTDEMPNFIPNQTYALRILENKANGSSVALPSEADDKGKRKWEFDKIQASSDVAGIRDHCKDLDSEIAEGIGIPNEVLEMAEGGGGWSGRKIPALAFYQSEDDIAATLIESIKLYALDYCVWVNFGQQEYEIEAAPISDILGGQQQGPGGQPGGPGGAPPPGGDQGGGGDPSAGLVQYQGPNGGHGWQNPTTGKIHYGLSGHRIQARAAFSALDKQQPSIEDAHKALILAMLELQIAASETGDPSAVQHELDALAHLARNPDDLAKAINPIPKIAAMGWVQEGTTGAGVIRWRNPETRELRYQQTEPGHRARKQAERTASEGHARGILQKVAVYRASPEDMEALATHLPAVGRQHLQNARVILRASFGGGRRRDQMISALVEHAHRHAQAMRSAGPTTPVDELPPGAVPGQSTPHMPKHGAVYNVATEDLHADPGRFQYKISDIDPKTGTTGELKSTKKFNPDLAGVLSVWKDPKDGKTYVVNGHHRYELAKRTGHPNLAVRYLNAATPEEARAKGALINMAEGRGSALDAAKFMRDSGRGPEHLAEEGVSLTGKTVEKALALKELADPLFAKVAHGKLDENEGAAIAAALPGMHSRQVALHNLIESKRDDGKDPSLGTIATMAKRMRIQESMKQQGGGDLFGEAPEDDTAFVESSELQDYAHRELSKEVRDFEAVSDQRRADRVKGEGNVLEVQANKAKRDKLKAGLEHFTRNVGYKGGIADIFNKAGMELKNAKSKSERERIRQDVMGSVRSALSGTDSGTTQGVHEGSQRTPETGDDVRTGESVPGKSDAAGGQAPGSEVTEGGKTFKTGVPITFPHIRNTEKAPKAGPGDQYQQNIEPHGRYLSHDDGGVGAAGKLQPGWEAGTTTFENPLVMPHNEKGGVYDEHSWKKKLSEQFDGKTGKELSQAIADAGHDGIVTHNKYGTSEIVDLSTFKKPEPKPEEDAGQKNIMGETLPKEFTANKGEQKTIGEVFDQDTERERAPTEMGKVEDLAGDKGLFQPANVDKPAGKDLHEMTRAEFANVETSADVPEGMAGVYRTKTGKASVRPEHAGGHIAAHEAAHVHYDGVQNASVASAFSDSPKAFEQFKDTATGKSYTKHRGQGPEPQHYDWQEALADLSMERAAGRLKDTPELTSVLDNFDRHRQAVVGALNAGKTVPPEVMKDYPDLAGKGKAAAKPSGGKMLSKDEAKAEAAKMPAPTHLPDNLSDYFKIDDKSEIVPLNKMISTRARPEGVANAGKYMELSRQGRMEKRDPIKVVDNGDGTFEVADGNSTYNNADKYGWKGLPIERVSREWLEKERAKTVEKESKKALETTHSDKLFPEHTTLPKDAVSAHKTKDALYDAAHKLKPQFDVAMNKGKGLDKALGAAAIFPKNDAEYEAALNKPGTLIVIGGVKGEERATQKATEEEHYEDGTPGWDRLHDMVRGTVAIDTFADMPKAVEALKGELDKHGWKLVKKPKNRIHNPTNAGYRDILLNFTTPEGTTGEIQLNTKAMIKAKHFKGHKWYERMRDIEGKATEQKRKMTSEEQGEYDNLAEQSKKLYETAWHVSLGAAHDKELSKILGN